MKEIKFLLRNGRDADRAAIHDLMAHYEMEADLAPSEFLVVEIDQEVVGAARLEWEGQAVYLRPIVVHPDWHGKNIGQALIRMISQGLSALHVIARGDAAGFYQKQGFIPLPWDQVPERFRQECEFCPDLEQCRPEPMVMQVGHKL